MTTRKAQRQLAAERRLRTARWDTKTRRMRLFWPVVILVVLFVSALPAL